MPGQQLGYCVILTIRSLTFLLKLRFILIWQIATKKRKEGMFQKWLENAQKCAKIKDIEWSRVLPCSEKCSVLHRRWKGNMQSVWVCAVLLVIHSKSGSLGSQLAIAPCHCDFITTSEAWSTMAYRVLLSGQDLSGQNDHGLYFTSLVFSVLCF